jgi:hypothetical protein
VLGGPFYRPERPGTGVASVGAGAVSVEAPVAGMVRRAWTASAGVGVTSVARWLGLMTAEIAGSSGAWRTWSGRLLLLHSVGTQRTEGRAWAVDGEATETWAQTLAGVDS